MGLRGYFSIAMAIAMSAVPIAAQIAEPILTNSAIPFAPGSGGIKLDFVTGVGRAGGASQAIPEATLQLGAFRGLEALVRFPLLRVRLPSPVIGGGHIAMGARYLLTGGGQRRYAISSEVIIEAPTGDTRLVGDATEVIPALLAEWRPASRIAIHSNIRFDHSLGRTVADTAFLEYENAVAWLASEHIVPVFEFVGSTNTITSRTQMIAQPEVVVRHGSHWELKAGLQLGLNRPTPSAGIRTQLAWFWGKRE
jgi:hypothetical protein